MNSNNIMTCKIRLVIDDEPQEIRRITLENSFASDIELFKDKIRAVFPQVARTPFDITWVDSDNDSITIANDEDLIGAMMTMEGLKKFDVHLSAKEEEEADPTEMINESIASAMRMVTCNICNTRITRYRYKCMQCHDYDLCLNCEHAGHHSHHIMMRLANLEIPRFLPKIMGHMTRSARKAAHHAAKEAHRCAKATARAATSAAHGAANAAQGVAYGHSFKKGCKHQPESTPATGPGGCPAMDTGFLFDLASSFLGPFTQAASGASTTNAGATSTSQQAKQKAQQQNSQSQSVPTNSETAPQALITPDMVGDVLKNIFSAINTGVQTYASEASTGTSTPMQTATSRDDVVIVDPTPSPPSGPSVAPKTTFVPMEVETNAIYPNLQRQPTTAAPTSTTPTGNNNQTAAPEAGWTIINNSGVSKETTNATATAIQASAPEAPSAISAEDAKYAEALAHLKRMGFADNVDLKSLLQRYDGNIGFVVNHLFDRNAH